MEISITDLDQLKDHLATALESSLDRKLEPLVKRIEGLEMAGSLPTQQLRKDVDKLQANQAKALVGWTVLIAGTTLLIEVAKEWVVARFSSHS